jgi:hypothetical protein
LFDTSLLTSSANISSAVFSVYGTDKANGLGSPDYDVVASTPASNTTLAAADYGQLGTTVFASVAYASYDTAGYNGFSLDTNGIANVSKTGVSKFGARLSWDTDGSFGGSWGSAQGTRFNSNTADATGTTNDPKLVVTYTIPGGFFYISQ